MGCVKPHAVGVEKCLIHQVFGDHHIGHGTHHGRVCTGSDGYPLICQADGTHGHSRVNTHDTRAAFSGLRDKVIRIRAVTHLRRIPAPHQDVPGIQPVLTLTADLQCPIHRRCGHIDTGPGIAVVDTQAAAEHIHEAPRHVAAIGIGVTARAIGHEHGRVAVRFLDAVHLIGHTPQGLIPRNALEFALPALAGAFHGILQAIWMVLAPTVGSPARARPKLRIGHVICGAVVTLNAGNDPVLDVNLEQTLAPAVVRRATHTHHAVGPAWSGLGHGHLFHANEILGRGPRCHSAGQQGMPLDEPAPRQFVVRTRLVVEQTITHTQISSRSSYLASKSSRSCSRKATS